MPDDKKNSHFNFEAGRIQGDEKNYNSVALDIMSEQGIQVIDLNKFSYDIHSKFGKGDDDVHYTKEGYRELSKVITSTLEREIDKLKMKRSRTKITSVNNPVPPGCVESMQSTHPGT